MAITPRTFVHNPILLVFTSVVAGAGLGMLTAKSVSPAPARTDIVRVRVEQSAVAARAATETMQPARQRHGWLGVRIQTLTPERAKWAGVVPKHGVLILNVQKRLAADYAGIKPYDVVTSFNGHPVRSACELKWRVSSTAPGTRVPIRIIRGQTAHTYYPTLTNMPLQFSRR